MKKIIQPLDLRKQYKTHKTIIFRKIKQVLEDGVFILGENVKIFEKEFAQFCGCRYAVGVNSGTDALFLGLKSIGIGTGDEVILPVFTYIATAFAVSYTGARPVFVDIDEKTFNIDINKIEKSITSRTRAILPVHLFGQPANMEYVKKIASKHSLRIIEDAAQSHGALCRVGGITKKTGSMGDIGCFSFYPTKNLGAFGDAGMVTTDNETIYKNLILFRDYGRVSRYEHTIIGYNSRLDEIQASILRTKLNYLEKWNKQRDKIAKIYLKKLKGLPIVLPYEPLFVRSVYHQFVIKTDLRDSLQTHLQSKGITTLIHYPIPIHIQKCYSDLNYQKGDFPVAEECSRRVLSLPIYPELTIDSVNYICDSIRKFFNQ